MPRTTQTGPTKGKHDFLAHDGRLPRGSDAEMRKGWIDRFIYWIFTSIYFLLDGAFEKGWQGRAYRAEIDSLRRQLEKLRVENESKYPDEYAEEYEKIRERNEFMSNKLNDPNYVP